MTLQETIPLTKNFRLGILQDMAYLLNGGSKPQRIVEDYLRTQEVVFPGGKIIARNIARYLVDQPLAFDPRENPSRAKMLLEKIQFDS